MPCVVTLSAKNDCQEGRGPWVLWQTGEVFGTHTHDVDTQGILAMMCVCEFVRHPITECVHGCPSCLKCLFIYGALVSVWMAAQVFLASRKNTNAAKPRGYSFGLRATSEYPKYKEQLRGLAANWKTMLLASVSRPLSCLNPGRDSLLCLSPRRGAAAPAIRLPHVRSVHVSQDCTADQVLSLEGHSVICYTGIQHELKPPLEGCASNQEGMNNAHQTSLYFMSRLRHVVWRKIHLMNAALRSEVTGRGVTGSCPGRRTTCRGLGTVGKRGRCAGLGGHTGPTPGSAPHGALTKPGLGEPQATVATAPHGIASKFHSPCSLISADVQGSALPGSRRLPMPSETHTSGFEGAGPWPSFHFGSISCNPPSFLIFNYHCLLTFVLPVTSSI